MCKERAEWYEVSSRIFCQIYETHYENSLFSFKFIDFAACNTKEGIVRRIGNIKFIEHVSVRLALFDCHIGKPLDIENYGKICVRGSVNRGLEDQNMCRLDDKPFARKLIKNVEIVCRATRDYCRATHTLCKLNANKNLFVCTKSLYHFE